MDDADRFAAYERHFARVNTPPDWDAGERNPASLAFDKPWLPADKNCRVLDVGCGWGHLLMRMWCLGYRNIEGIDISEGQLKVCRQQAGERVEVQCVDAVQLLADKETEYDLILFHDVVEHLHEDELWPMLAAIKKALRPGGRMVMRTGNMTSIFAAYSRYIDMTHTRGFTEHNIQQLLDMAGFENHSLVPDEWGWQPRAWRPWAPWRGLGLRGLLNHWLHRALYYLRGESPRPRIFGGNLEVYTHKPRDAADGGK